MRKVIAGRVWVMSGRWQVMSLTENAPRPRPIERAWFASIFAPYWRGAGVALTLGPWSLRFGRCRPGLEIDESADEFSWDDLSAGFDEHLEASLFEPGPIDNVDEDIGQLSEMEPVTVFVDTRINKTIAMVHEGGEVEYYNGRRWVHSGTVPDQA